jgi:hypothetical protein
MKRFIFAAALLAMVAFAPIPIQTKATSPQASGVTHHASGSSKIYSAR